MGAREERAVLDLAERLDAPQLDHLADLEWRSRNAAWTEYLRAYGELADELSLTDFRRIRDAVERATALVALNVRSDTLARQSIAQAASCALLGPKLDRATHTFLTRAWRALAKEVTETS